jgi:prepilin-type N-terminal cleavage/methylation domain-containing protein
MRLRRGTSLVELVVVLAVLATLLAIGTSRYRAAEESTYDTLAAQALRTAATEADGEYLRFGTYPSAPTFLTGNGVALVDATTEATSTTMSYVSTGDVAGFAFRSTHGRCMLLKISSPGSRTDAATALDQRVSGCTGTAALSITGQAW